MMQKARCMNLKSLSVGLVTFLISLHAFSLSQINSEFEMVLPRQFQQHLIDQSWQTLAGREFHGNWQFSDQYMESHGVPVQLKGIRLDLKTFLDKPSLASEGGVVSLASKNMQAALTISEVSVDQVIEREVGGVRGRFRVQALCKNVVVNLQRDQGQFILKLLPQVGAAQASTQVQEVSLAWNPGSWVAETFTCEGVQGFANLLREAVENVSNDSESFVSPQKDAIKKYVAEYLKNINLDFSKSKTILLSRPDIQVLMRVDNYRDLGESGIYIRGTFEISFAKVADRATTYLKLNTSSAPPQSLQASLRLPQDFLKEVAGRAYAANTWRHQLSSEQIPGFSTLMRSRFYQFFVWPALMKFPKSSRFLFDIFSNKDVVIAGDGAKYTLQFPLLSQMFAPKSGEFVPFMNFNLIAKATVQMKVSNGKIGAQFTQTRLAINSQWDSSFLKKFSPATWFSSSLIRDYALEAIEGKNMTWELPMIPLGDSLQLKAQELYAPQGEDLILNLGL